MIEFEIVVTLVGTLIVALITVFQIQRNRIRKLKRNHDLEMLELAQKFTSDESNFESHVKQSIDEFYTRKESPLYIDGSYIWQVLFGILVLVLFTWGTYYHLTEGSALWAALTGIFALIGLAMPFIVWRENKQRKDVMARLSRGIEQFQKPIAKTEEKSQPQVQKPRQDERLVRETAEPTPPVNKEFKQKIPEDSVLRRHFFTNLRADIESGMAARPTDSILKRHYGTMVDDEFERRLSEMAT